ncbi:MAG: arabinofuranosidase catalytic domain-containing protein [Polyangiaceae bacterium]
MSSVSSSSAPGGSGSVDSGGMGPDGYTGEMPSGSGVCDIFASGGTPCVAAHSTVRALFGAYDGSLYQVTRASDQTTKDIGVLSAGGFADAATQDTFCAGTTCTISIIYDQSSQGNHLTPGPAGQHGSGADKPANATDLKTTASGHEVYGVRILVGSGYRNDKATGTATGDEAETEYMISSQNNLVNGCCYDYGNAETNNRDDGDATMEAVYFGMGSGQATGVGPGPWVEVDIENGLCAGVDANGAKEAKGVTTNMSLAYDYATAVVVGRSGAAPGSFALYGGDATAGTLTTMYDGARPNGYAPMKKQGAIILGIGGDNSNGAAGDFYEGVMTTGAATVATLNAVQANIVAAGYGK